MRVLEFIPATRKVLRQLASEPEEFAAEYGVSCCTRSRRASAQAGLKFVRTFPYETPPEWFGYLAVEGETQKLCGVCTFQRAGGRRARSRSRITRSRDSKGRGIGTEMARFLVERARALPDVTKVIAHTLPERNASARILEKIGMRFTGDAEEDGEPVWRWELDLAG